MNLCFKTYNFSFFLDFFIFILGLMLSDDDKKKYALLEIEKILKRSGTSLAKFDSMPKPPKISIHDENVLVLDERSYERSDLSVLIC